MNGYNIRKYSIDELATCINNQEDHIRELEVLNMGLREEIMVLKRMIKKLKAEKELNGNDYDDYDWCDYRELVR